MNLRERSLQTRISGQGRNAAALSKWVGDAGSMVEPTPAIKWTVADANPTTGVQVFSAQVTDQSKQKWTGRWHVIVHVAATADGDPTGSGHTVAFGAGTVLQTMIANAAYLVLSDVNGVVTLTITPNSPSVRRYVYSEVYGKPVSAGASAKLPLLFAALFQDAAGVDYGSLPIESGNVQAFNNIDMADLPTFEAAVAFKFPGGPSSTGVAYLQGEVPPVQIPNLASQFTDPMFGWSSALALLLSELNWATANYTNINWTFYKGPSLSFEDGTSTDPTNRDAWSACINTPGNLVDLVVPAQSLMPELFPRHREATQDQLVFWMQNQADICASISAAAGGGPRKLFPVIYATEFGPPYQPGYDFLPAEELAMYLIACMACGSDGIYIAGQQTAHTHLEWQRWAGTTLPQAMRIAGWPV